MHEFQKYSLIIAYYFFKYFVQCVQRFYLMKQRALVDRCSGCDFIEMVRIQTTLSFNAHSFHWLHCFNFQTVLDTNLLDWIWFAIFWLCLGGWLVLLWMVWIGWICLCSMVWTLLHFSQGSMYFVISFVSSLLIVVMLTSCHSPSTVTLETFYLMCTLHNLYWQWYDCMIISQSHAKYED